MSIRNSIFKVDWSRIEISIGLNVSFKKIIQSNDLMMKEQCLIFKETSKTVQHNFKDTTIVLKNLHKMS